MIVIQFLQDLLHNRFTEEDRLGTYTKLLAILAYRCHFAVIQIYYLSMATHKRLLLLLKIFGIDSRSLVSLFSLCHYLDCLTSVKREYFGAKLAFY